MCKYFYSFLLAMSLFAALIGMSAANSYAQDGKILVKCGQDDEIEFPAYMYYLLSPSLQKDLGELDSLLNETMNVLDTTGTNTPRMSTPRSPRSPRGAVLTSASSSSSALPGSPRGLVSTDEGASGIQHYPWTNKSKKSSRFLKSPRFTQILVLNKKTDEGSIVHPLQFSGNECSPRMIKVGRIDMSQFDSHLLKALSEIVVLLSKAARDCNGQKVSPENIGTDTIFVSSYVRENSKQISDRVLGAYLLRMGGKITKQEDKSVETSEENDSKDVRKKRPVSKLILERVSQAFSTGSDSEKRTLHQTWGDLYKLSLELGMKDVANILAKGISDLLPQEDDNGLEDKSCLIGSLSENQFGSFSTDQLGYLKKHLALKALGAEELSIADYIGMKGLNGIVSRDRVWLSRKRLTSLKGIGLLKNPEAAVKSIHLKENYLLSRDLDPDCPKKPFAGFGEKLEKVYLNNNCLTSLPQGLVTHLPSLKTIHVENNFLPDSAEEQLSNKGFSPQKTNTHKGVALDQLIHR